ncbi:MAG: hypothetical protein ACKO0Z_23080 [Betaproteobacteria bacterium]
MIKTGECFCRDDEGNLLEAESFVDSEGCVVTKQSMVADDEHSVSTEIAQSVSDPLVL